MNYQGSLQSYSRLLQFLPVYQAYCFLNLRWSQLPQATSNDAEAERLAKDAEFLRERLREAEELLSRYKTDNMMLHQRVEMAERDRGAMEHGNFLELEKVLRATWQ